MTLTNDFGHSEFCTVSKNYEAGNVRLWAMKDLNCDGPKPLKKTARLWTIY